MKVINANITMNLDRQEIWDLATWGEFWIKTTGIRHAIRQGWAPEKFMSEASTKHELKMVEMLYSCIGEIDCYHALIRRIEREITEGKKGDKK